MRKQESARPTAGGGGPGSSRRRFAVPSFPSTSILPCLRAAVKQKGAGLQPHLQDLAEQAAIRAHLAGVLANDAKAVGDVAGFARWRRRQLAHQAIFRAAVRPGQGGDHAPEES